MKLNGIEMEFWSSGIKNTSAGIKNTSNYVYVNRGKNIQGKLVVHVCGPVFDNSFYNQKHFL